MCQTCWEEYGADTIVNDRTIKCAKLVYAVYECTFAGGHGHVVFDDHNIGDESIDRCLVDNWHDLPKAHKEEYTKIDWHIVQSALQYFKTLTFAERNAALGIYENYFDHHIKL